MKNIKLRAWNKKEKYMDDDFCVHADGCVYQEARNKYDTPNQEIEPDYDGLTVIEFTGLKDNNGKEIYHKDLIVNLSRNGKSPHVVEWSDKLGGWVGVYGFLEYLIAQELNEIELVGNIFENKHLIK